MVTLKKLIGEGGAGFDDSMGFNNLYDVLKALTDSHAQLVAQFNQLLIDHNAEEFPSTATALTLKVQAE
jgi:hypothetical protein